MEANIKRYYFQIKIPNCNPYKRGWVILQVFGIEPRGRTRGGTDNLLNANGSTSTELACLQDEAKENLLFKCWILWILLVTPIRHHEHRANEATKTIPKHAFSRQRIPFRTLSRWGLHSTRWICWDILRGSAYVYGKDGTEFCSPWWFGKGVCEVLGGWSFWSPWRRIIHNVKRRPHDAIPGRRMKDHNPSRWVNDVL